ncbi:rhomboid family intramembrane serine protease [Bacillus sp. FJAT-45350]|uniref:rhomboid family intramembrane serine protease n=1 Tax=Bacillus sp. FJAT-45350 TaxID=2011014 RepID=UPI000BB77A49|nr:rhomboid family intramembrane serine protease [Bacillus sp. FJAT-45350]
MDVVRHDLFYFQLVHNLVIDNNMRVIEISPDKREIWLEQEDGKEKRIIRLVRYDIDWANWLKKELETANRKFDFLRKQLGTRKLHCENIYVSMYTPVDSWEHLLDEPSQEKAKMTIKTTIIPANVEEKEEEVASLYNRIELAAPPLTEWAGTNENEYEQIEALSSIVKATAEARLEKERSLFTFGKPLFTYLFLILNLVMFIVLELNGGSTRILTLIEFGAKYNPLIIEGEWWRFVSAMFLHIGLLHFFMNSLALFYLGGVVERIYGSKRFFIIYFIAGLFGSVASFALNNQISAGASGAIFGCFGALLYFGLIHKTLFFRTIGMSVIIILVINLIFGFVVPMIDNGAHIGGLIGGFLATSFLHLPKHKKSWRQVPFFILTVILFASLLGFGFINEDKRGTPLVYVQIAQEYLQQEENERAYPLLKNAVDEGVDIPEAYFLLAYSEAHLEYFEDAKENLLIAIQKRRTFHEAHYNLALVYSELGEVEKAYESVSTAIQLEPNEELYQEIKEKLEERMINDEEIS